VTSSLQIFHCASRRRPPPGAAGGSADGLRKTGIFADKAGVRQSGSPETKANAQKAGISDPFSRLLGSLVKRGNRWLGRGVRTSIWRIRNRILLPVREGAAEPHFVNIHRPLETFEFREPYRIHRVQSFGEKWAFRRRMSRLRRLEVRSSNEQSLLLLG
jgi:hypothetical protein